MKADQLILTQYPIVIAYCLRAPKSSPPIPRDKSKYEPMRYSTIIMTGLEEEDVQESSELEVRKAVEIEERQGENSKY